MMKDQVLMNPGVVQLEPSSLERSHQAPHVQEDRVDHDPSLVVQRSARRGAHLLLNLELGQPYDETNSAVHSLLAPEWWHVAGELEERPPQTKLGKATAHLWELEHALSPPQ